MWRSCCVFLAAFAILSNAYLVYRDDISLNSSPKLTNIFSNACAECQIVVRRLSDVAQDPGKIAEVKAILLVLCDETSYKEECRMFVSRLDLFFNRLLPYLKDPHAVCQKLHICKNEKLQTLHEIGKFFALKKIENNAAAASILLCDECHFAIDELKTIISNQSYENEVKEFLSHEVCAYLGRAQGACDSVLEDFLPDLWQELKQLLSDGNKFCVDLKLCKKGSKVALNDDDNDENDALPAVSVGQSRQHRLRAKVSKTLWSTLLLN